MDLNNKNIMVTGGAGFIGSNLVDRLILEKPSSIVVVDNFFLGSEGNLLEAKKNFPSLKVYRLDGSNLSAMKRVVEVEKIDIVFNLAVIPLPTSLHYPAWTIETNIQLALTFCELAKWGDIKTLIHCSSSEAYGSAIHDMMNENHPLLPNTPYAASKAAADQIVLSYYHTYGIDTAIARPFNNFGPRQNSGSYAGIIPIVVDRVTRGVPIEIFGDGLQTRDFIFVRYTVDAMVRICNSPLTRGRVVNIATGQEITINDLVSRLVKVMDVPDYPVIHTSPRPGDVRRHCGDSRLLQELTGFESKAISDDNLQETIEWYRRQIG